MCICNVEGCNGLCEAAIGRRLYTLFKELRARGMLREVVLGKAELSTHTSKEYIYPTGYKFYRRYSDDSVSNDYSRTLTRKAPVIKKENRFSVNNSNIGGYLKKFNSVMRFNDFESVKDDIDKFISGKLIIHPWQFDKEYSVLVKEPDKAPKEHRLVLREAEYCVDKETNEVGWKLHFGDKKDSSSRKVVDINAYGREWYLSDEAVYGRVLETGAVSFTKFGYVRPVVLVHNSVRVAIDNESIYLNEKEIGHWTEKDTISVAVVALTDKKILSWVRDNKYYIAKYRKIMAPYKLVEAVEIKID